MSNLQWEMQAYGDYKDEIVNSVKDSITFKLSGPGMVIASYLSDAHGSTAEGGHGSGRFVSPGELVVLRLVGSIS